MQKATKTLALILSIAMILLTCFPSIGIYPHCPWVNRLCYHFFHAGFFHLSANLWCFLSLVFIHKISIWFWATAFIIASTVPGIFLMPTPTVGLSAICFAILGMTAYRYSLRSTLYIICWILIGLALPSVNWMIHLYCWVVGIIVSLLYKPLPCHR